MGIFDSLFGLGTNKNTLNASRDLNKENWQVTNLGTQLLQDRGDEAKRYAQQGASDALATLQGGRDNALNDVVSKGAEAQSALQDGTGQALGTINASTQLFAPTYAQGQQAGTMYGNALGLNGQAGNDAATTAFRASPGYQYSVDQATDAAARKAASLGMAGSGNTLDAVTRLAGNLADQQYGSFLDRLQGLNSQGFTAASAINSDNVAGASLRANAGNSMANLINGQGSTLGTLDNSLGVNKANVSSNLGTTLGTIGTQQAQDQISNFWRGMSQINGNTMGAAQAQDRTDSANNGIFSKLLMGGAGSGGGGGIFGNLLGGFKL